MSEVRNTGRTVYYDYLRVLATVSVMTVHIVGTNWATVDVNSFNWKMFNFYESIVRWCVPMFVMISGALFLGRDDISLRKVYTKYIPRMIVAFFTWGFIYYLYGGESVISQFVLLFQSGKIDRLVSIICGHYHEWFVLMITGIYMCIPIINQIVKDEKVSSYFLILSLIFWFVIPEAMTIIAGYGSENIVAILNAVYDVIKALNLGFIMNFVFYFILGYKMSRIQFEKKYRICIYIVGIIGYVSTIFMNYIISIKMQMPSEIFFSNSFVNILFEAVGTFELFKNISFKSGVFNKLVGYLSKWSFGAYLVHVLIIETLQSKGIHTLSFNPIIAIPTLVVVVFIISFVISAILNCIPVVKKYCV